MRLIIGGFAQGKTEYARSTCHNAEVISFADMVSNGKSYVDEIIIVGLNDWVREAAITGTSEDELIGKVNDVVARCPEAVIITDENGNGVIPLEKRDRDYRDIVGHIQICLAADARKVERVICGIPRIIK